MTDREEPATGDESAEDRSNANADGASPDPWTPAEPSRAAEPSVDATAAPTEAIAVPTEETAPPTEEIAVPTEAPNLTAMFGSLVADPPRPTVSPLTVLAEVRTRRSRRARRAGGLVAAAVVIGAFVLIVPQLHGGSTESNSSAGSAVYESDAASSAASGTAEFGASSSEAARAPGAGSSDSALVSEQASAASSAASSPAAMPQNSPALPGSPGGAAGSGAASEAEPDAGGSVAAGSSTESARPSATSAVATSAESSAGSSTAAASTSAAATSAASTSAADASSGQSGQGHLVLAPLPDSLLRAALDALPADSFTGFGDGVGIAYGWLYGSVLNMDRGGPVTVVVANGEIGPLPDGAVVASKDGLTVRVTADQASDGHLTQRQLAAVADAVAAAID